MILLFVYLGIALVFSFLCSVAEAVLLSVSRGYIQSLGATKPVVARRLRGYRDKPEEPLSAILTLNTIAHTVGAAGVGHQAAVVFGAQWMGLYSAVLTFLILVGSEIIPKTLGATHWRKLAPITSTFIHILVLSLYPVIVLLRKITNQLSHTTPEERSRDEIESTILLASESDLLSETESKMLRNVLTLRNIHARKIMTPRVVLFAVPASMTVEDYLAENEANPFSRVPIYVDSIDEVTGYVLHSALVRAKDKSLPVSTWSRELVTVFEMSSVRDVYERLADGNHQIALVANEFGGTAGVVTLEDVLETLVGREIVDEMDPAANLRQVARDRNLLRG
jgi:CBS domain containing-hemolysin-like protein